MLNETVYSGNLSRIVKAFDGIYFREANLELRDQCNTGIIELDNSVALIDYPEQHPDEELIEEAEKLTQKPVKYILLTHAHCDHVNGLKHLHRKDISLLASNRAIEELIAEGFKLPDVCEGITESKTIELDGVEFKFEFPGGRAHSPWDMLIGLPKHKIVFTGDLVVRQKYMFFHTSDIEKWKDVIEMLQKSDWEYFARGHGFICDKKYLDDVGHYLDLLSKAKELYGKNPELISESSVLRRELSPEMEKIMAELVVITDMNNAVRQINQLIIRTAKGF